MQIGVVLVLRQTGLLIATPFEDEFAGFATRVTGQNLTQDAVRMEVENAIGIKRESRRAGPLLRLKAFAQFACIAMIGQGRAPDMDLAVFEAGAIGRDVRDLALNHIRRPDAGWRSR